MNLPITECNDPTCPYKHLTDQHFQLEMLQNQVESAIKEMKACIQSDRKIGQYASSLIIDSLKKALTHSRIKMNTPEWGQLPGNPFDVICTYCGVIYNYKIETIKNHSCEEKTNVYSSLGLTLPLS